MRKDDDKQYRAEAFRADRVYFSDGAWWVATREGERGPFPTKELAATDAHNYGRRVQRDRLLRPPTFSDK